jgi:RNA polymerase sigma factor (TIGR02999 family)
MTACDPATDQSQALLPAAYARLRAIAAGQRRRLPLETLHTTALVNEAWLRLADAQREASDRQQFFGLFAHVVRNVLIDHVRARKALKRDAPRVALDDLDLPDPDAPELEQLLQVDAALTSLAGAHRRLVQVVEMRFFAGYDNHEIAEILGVNEKTVRRDWLMARALLAQTLDGL